MNSGNIRSQSVDYTRFIKEKIYQLKSAIFFPHNSELNLPAAPVEALEVEDSGCVWIAVNPPEKMQSNGNKYFNAALNFFSKGLPFRLNVYGKARLITDPEEAIQLPFRVLKKLKEGLTPVCIQVLEATYFESGEGFIKSVLGWCFNAIKRIFLPGKRKNKSLKSGNFWPGRSVPG